MTATLFSAVITCLASLFIGQAALRLAGAREWSWLAPLVGISVVMLIATPAIHVPGRSATVAALVGALTVAAIVWCARAPAHRPPLAGLLAASPVMLMVLIPFLTAGREGILGTSLDNDMGSHMFFVEQYMSQAVTNVTPLRPDYPVGPHAMVALIADGLGIRVDRAFAGWSMALPILNAWTALALARRASWLKQVMVATVVGMPFLVAAYYGEGSFKEVLQAGLVLAVALAFSGYGPTLGRGRWVPLALLVGGIVSVYSVTGLPWPAMIAGLWVVGTVGWRIARRGTKGLKEAVRRELPPVGIGLAVLFLSLLPQVRRIHSFAVENFGGNGIITPKDNLGNLAGPLPGWEAFGVWNTADFRFPASPAFTGGMWTAFVLALVLFGAVWAIRSGRWVLPLAAGGSMLIWAISTNSQSPYNSAKGLVIASPLLLAVAVLPLIERGPDRWPRSRSALATLFRRAPGLPLSWGLASLLGLVLFLRVGFSDVPALRASPVGPTAHLEQLRSLRPLLHGQPTLFLGNDDFIEWELSGVPLGAAVNNGGPKLPLRPEKEWASEDALDFDSVDAATLNAFDWVITTRDAAGSAPPPQLRPVRTTDGYALWHRVGTVKERAVLAEGDMPGAVLDCRTHEGRAVMEAGGVAAVRTAPVVTPVPAVAAGDTIPVRVVLPPGTWELETPYISPLPVAVASRGLHATLPANLDRVGPRWRIGRIEVNDRRPVTVSIHVDKTALTPAGTYAIIGSLIATPRAAERIVSVRDACGRYVDWYRSAAPAQDRRRQ
jgi:hypothetical protein